MTVQQCMTEDFVRNQLNHLSACQEMVESYSIEQITAIESQIKKQQAFDGVHSTLRKVICCH